MTLKPLRKYHASIIYSPKTTTLWLLKMIRQAPLIQESQKKNDLLFLPITGLYYREISQIRFLLRLPVPALWMALFFSYPCVIVFGWDGKPNMLNLVGTFTIPSALFIHQLSFPFWHFSIGYSPLLYLLQQNQYPKQNMLVELNRISFFGTGIWDCGQNPRVF